MSVAGVVFPHCRAAVLAAAVNRPAKSLPAPVGARFGPARRSRLAGELDRPASDGFLRSLPGKEPMPGPVDLPPRAQAPPKPVDTTLAPPRPELERPPADPPPPRRPSARTPARASRRHSAVSRLSSLSRPKSNLTTRPRRYELQCIRTNPRLHKRY